MDPFQILGQMLELQAAHGAAELKATQHMHTQLKQALATLRRRNQTLYALKLSAMLLPPEERFRLPTGGLVTLRLVLQPRDQKHMVPGAQAAHIRSLGGQVDGIPQPQTALEQQIERERAAYELWKHVHPNGTFEEACAAGHEAEATADRTAQEIVERRQAERRTNERKSGGDFFAEFEKKLGIAPEKKD